LQGTESRGYIKTPISGKRKEKTLTSQRGGNGLQPQNQKGKRLLHGKNPGSHGEGKGIPQHENLMPQGRKRGGKQKGESRPLGEDNILWAVTVERAEGGKEATRSPYNGRFLSERDTREKHPAKKNKKVEG